MKTHFILLSLISILFTNMNTQAQTSPKAKKILVVYFSHSGNTREIANQIKNATDADIFEIQPVTPYPSEHQAVVDQAKKEINEGYKPALKTKLENIDAYDIIFVGSPNWWATIAPPVATFLSGYDFSGKTIVPFITHEGSRIGRSASDIKKICPKSTVLDGLPIRGSYVKNAQKEVTEYLREIKIIK